MRVDHDVLLLARRLASEEEGSEVPLAAVDAAGARQVWVGKDSPMLLLEAATKTRQELRNKGGCC